MFSVHCPQHGRSVLLSLRHILGIENGDQVTTVRWVCWCGHRGLDHFRRGDEVSPGAGASVAA